MKIRKLKAILVTCVGLIYFAIMCVPFWFVVSARAVSTWLSDVLFEVEHYLVQPIHILTRIMVKPMIHKDLAVTYDSAKDVRDRKSMWMVEYLRARRSGDDRLVRYARKNHFHEKLICDALLNNAGESFVREATPPSRKL